MLQHSPRNRSRSPLRTGPSFSRNFETVTVDVGQCRSRTRQSDRRSTSRTTATATHYDNYCYNNKLTSSESSTMSEAIREAARCLLEDKHLLQETIDAIGKNKILAIGKKTILKRLEELFVVRLEKITLNRRSMSVHDIIRVYNKCFTKSSEELLVTRLCSELNYLCDMSIAKDSEVAIVVDEYSQRDGLKTGIDNAESPIEQENIVEPETASEGIAKKIEITEDASIPPLLDGSDSTFWVVVDEVLEDVQPNTLKPGETIERTATYDNTYCNIEINENVTLPVNETGPVQQNNTRKKRGKKNKKNGIKRKPNNKYPMFNMVVQIIYKQMKKHTTMLDPKMKEKLTAVASERLRMRLRNMLQGSNEYLHSSHIIMLYRKLYPIEGDEQFVNEVVNDIKNRKYRSILDNQELGNSTELAKENQTPNTIWNPTIQAETTIETPSDISKENAIDNVTMIPPEVNIVPASETDYTLDDDVILIPVEVEVITISDNEGEYDARVEVADEPVMEETQSETAVNPTVEAKGTPEQLQTLHVVSNTNNSKSCGYNMPSALSVEVFQAEIQIKTSEHGHSFPKNTVNSNIAAKITSGDKTAKVCNLMSVPENSVAVPQSQDKGTASEHDNKNKEIIQENASIKQVSLDVATDRNSTQGAYVSTRPVDSDLNTANVKTEHNVPTEDIVKDEQEPEESVESIKNFIELISKIVDLT